MSTTRFDDTVKALISLYEAAPAVSVPVYDGPQVMTASDPAYVVVGHDGTLTADGSLSPNVQAGNFTQSDLEMPGIRQETGFVACVLVCQTGDSADVPGQRARASGLLTAAEDAIAANGGYTGTGIMFAGTSDGRWLYRQTASGIAVLLAYRVSYSTGWS